MENLREIKCCKIKGNGSLEAQASLKERNVSAKSFGSNRGESLPR